MKLVQHRFLLMGIALVGTGVVGSACTSSDPADESGTGGSAGSTTMGGSAGTTTAGGTAGTGGSTAGTAGTGGTGGDEVDCSAPIAITAGMVIDFETYDGVMDGVDTSFTFGDDTTGYVTMGPFALNEADDVVAPDVYMGGDYFLGLIEGADSLWAMSASNTNAIDWGGGIGFWTGCMDATGHTGITFMAKGTSGRDNIGQFGFSQNGATEYRQEFTMSGDWAAVQLPFASFLSDAGAAADGSNISSMWFTAGVAYTATAAVPAAFEVSIDDFGFY